MVNLKNMKQSEEKNQAERQKNNTIIILSNKLVNTQSYFSKKMHWRFVTILPI